MHICKNYPGFWNHTYGAQISTECTVVTWLFCKILGLLLIFIYLPSKLEIQPFFPLTFGKTAGDNPLLKCLGK